MKNTIFKAVLMAVLVWVFFAFTAIRSGSITGKVIPPEAVRDVWAISATDTVKASLSQGSFNLTNVKAGTYKVIIDANAPYKDVIKEAVSVTEGQPVDMGEIKLDK